MRDAFIDVLVEIPTADLAAESDPTAHLYRLMTNAADRECALVGAQLRTDRVPEVLVQQAQHPLLSVAMTLVASRWAVRVPDAVAAAL